MRDRRVDRPTQRALTFDRHEVWPTLPDRAQRQCADLISQLLRAVFEEETTPRSHDDRQTSPRSS